MYEGLSLESLERLESIISKDNIFVKKHSGMFNYLKIGFSVLKEYVKADASNEKQVELFSDKSESNKDTADNQTLINQKSISAHDSVNIELKTETLENNSINASSIPVSFVYYNRTVNVSESWVDLYTKFMKIFWLEKGRQLSTYIESSFVNELIIDIGDVNTAKYMQKPKRIADNVFIETNLNYREIMNRIKAVLDKTAVPAKRFSITYISYIKKTDIMSRVVSEPQKSPERVSSKSSSSSYIEWLVKTCKLAEITARHYYSSVRRAEEIAKEQELVSQRLLTADNYDEAEATYHELLKNSKFVSMNESAHNGFTASINKYLQYLLSGGTKTDTSMSQPVKIRYNEELIEKCLDVLRESFSNGIKKGADIAKRRFCNAYNNKYGTALPESVNLDDLFSESTLEYDGKFYATSTELTDFIGGLLQNYPIGSYMLFFYDTFYDKHISELSKLGVYSSEMLKSVLKREFPGYYYKTSHFSTSRGLTLEQMVSIAYGENICMTIEKLQECLPYIDKGQILPVLSRSGSGFVRIEDGKYANESRINIVQSDIDQSRTIIKDDIRSQGFSFTTQLIVEESEYENPEIPISALQIVLFDKHLSNEFSRNRTLIAPLGETDSMVNVLKSYCKKHRKITLEEVESYEKELTGEDNARRSLRVVSETMIRVTADTFVDEINFDVDSVDNAIEPFLSNRKIISLKNVTSFSAFPDVEDYIWSSYLLSSYLKRYSKQWGYIGEEHKKKSVGAIFDKSLMFENYDDAMAQAVADSGIELTQEEVSFFLRNNEYRLRDADFKDIISKAYQIRMREE